MSLLPFLNASPIVQLHALAAVPALVLGPVALWRERRDRRHRILGRLWVASMAALAGTGLMIPSHGLALVGPFGPIHALCLFVLWSLARAIGDARARRIEAHSARMRGLYFGALGVAGLFTFLPGRTLNRMAFPDLPEAGWAVIALVGVALAALWMGASAGRANRPCEGRKKPLHILRPNR